MPNQAAITRGTRIAAQTKPAFWMKVGVPAVILPRIQPLSFSNVIGAPAIAPKRPTVITSGIRTCMVVTPKLPSPALSPRAVPCRRLGKKPLMLDMEQAKLPPPMPDRNAQNWNTHSGVVLSCREMPVPMAGMMSSAEVRKMVLRPPQRRMKNDAGMRRVAPISPEIAVSVNISAGVKGKPRFSICTVMMPHISHMAKPHSRLGIEIHRLRLAMPLAFDSQKASSSTSHCAISAELWLTAPPVPTEPRCSFLFIIIQISIYAVNESRERFVPRRSARQFGVSARVEPPRHRNACQVKHDERV